MSKRIADGLVAEQTVPCGNENLSILQVVGFQICGHVVDVHGRLIQHLDLSIKREAVANSGGHLQARWAVRAKKRHGNFAVHPDDGVGFLQLVDGCQTAIKDRSFFRCLGLVVHVVDAYNNAVRVHPIDVPCHCHNRVRVGGFLTGVFDDVKPDFGADEQFVLLLSHGETVRSGPCERIQRVAVVLEQNVLQAFPDCRLDEFGDSIGVVAANQGDQKRSCALALAIGLHIKVEHDSGVLRGRSPSDGSIAGSFRSEYSGFAAERGQVLCEVLGLRQPLVNQVLKIHPVPPASARSRW